MPFEELMLWVGFNVFIIIMLALDLFVFNKNAHEIKVKEALGWSVFWVSLAGLFNIGIYFLKGKAAALEFLTGYLIEESLSVDNLFVFLVIFSYFKVPKIYQHKVLFWGILGAIVMRATFIACGITLIKNFHFIIYIFGAFLVYTGIKMVTEKDKEVHPEHNIFVRLFRRIMPVTHEYHEGNFFVVKEGVKYATPLFVVLIVIETTDLLFAVDSVPAILAITQDPFIVYTSNIFAILGLRAIYFALAGTIHLFHYLHYGLSAILVFVGAKMLLSDIIHIPVGLSLGVVITILVGSVAASLLLSKKDDSNKAISPHT
ncbi:MAG: TerC family protein [Candidatus Omnitrophica bacterium]|nr:TerC family protein [Candidatus Omnitrophota bacterium]